MAVLGEPGVVELLSGNVVDLTAFSSQDINIEDIAWGLGRTLRFGGHMRQDYTVANHCIIMSYIVPERFALEALLHDAAEAYIGDIVAPVKNLFPAIVEWENTLLIDIMDRFSVPVTVTRKANGVYCYSKSGEVARVDKEIGEHEAWSFGLSHGIEHPEIEEAWLKAAIAHEQWWHAPTYAFLERFDQLTGSNSLDLNNLTKLWFSDDTYSDEVVSQVEAMVAEKEEQQALALKGASDE